ncbi:hypothetical protein ACO0LC_28745, partial [Undibacterium sp. JH2W]|uniref:hypothetical protein n=1 Tax=Undibacterium sp. JH2W TaxID=3413037 RepID=UPI003BEFE9ED
VYGTSSLWYLIADANGLTAESSLTEGNVITIPNTAQTGRIDSQRFKVYNASEIEGSKMPNMASPGPGGCAIVTQIISLVVQIVVTAYTGNPMLGNLAGQAINNIGGIQHGFNAKSFATSVVSYYVPQIPFVDSNVPAAGFINAVGNNLVTQGVLVATRLQDKIDWKQAAAAGAASVITGQFNEWFKETPVNPGETTSERVDVNTSGKSLPDVSINGVNPAESWGHAFMRDGLTNLATSISTSLITTGKVDWQNAIINGLGSGLGAAANNLIGQTAWGQERLKALEAERAKATPKLGDELLNKLLNGRSSVWGVLTNKTQSDSGVTRLSTVGVEPATQPSANQLGFTSDIFSRWRAAEQAKEDARVAFEAQDETRRLSQREPLGSGGKSIEDWKNLNDTVGYSFGSDEVDRQAAENLSDSKFRLHKPGQFVDFSLKSNSQPDTQQKEAAVRPRVLDILVDQVVSSSYKDKSADVLQNAGLFDSQVSDAELGKNLLNTLKTVDYLPDSIQVAHAGGPLDDLLFNLKKDPKALRQELNKDSQSLYGVAKGTGKFALEPLMFIADQANLALNISTGGLYAQVSDIPYQAAQRNIARSQGMYKFAKEGSEFALNFTANLVNNPMAVYDELSKRAENYTDKYKNLSTSEAYEKGTYDFLTVASFAWPVTDFLNTGLQVSKRAAQYSFVRSDSEAVITTSKKAAVAETVTDVVTPKPTINDTPYIYLLDKNGRETIPLFIAGPEAIKNGWIQKAVGFTGETLEGLKSEQEARAAVQKIVDNGFPTKGTNYNVIDQKYGSETTTLLQTNNGTPIFRGVSEDASLSLEHFRNNADPGNYLVVFKTDGPNGIVLDKVLLDNQSRLSTGWENVLKNGKNMNESETSVFYYEAHKNLVEARLFFMEPNRKVKPLGVVWEKKR